MAKTYTSLSEIKNGLLNGDITVEGLVKNYLAQIEINTHLNAFNEVFADEALARAVETDAKLKAGTAGKLAGMVISIKDNILYKGHKATASSKILDNYTAIYSSTIVERLLAEDAIIIGRCNCDEFAMGASNESSYYGVVKNHADESRVPGGSSGGSAVSVQAGMCHAAIGTDTGGSVRQPASFCGMIGFKPTYGRISRHGIIAYASSFDQVGSITHSVEDAALLLEIMAGTDAYDSTLSKQAIPAYSTELKTTTSPKKVAYLREAVERPGLDPQIKDALLKTIADLKAAGNIVEPVSFEYLDYVVPTYYILTMAEASSNLARYDGVHYGYRSPKAVDMMSTYKLSRSEGFGVEVKRRIMLGTFILSAGYYDAYYTKAQKMRRLIREKTEEILNKYDFILTPTAPEPAFKIGREEKDPVVSYLADIFTVQASLSGMPAISLPVKNTTGLPFGLQLVAKRFDEQELLNFSKNF
ncbi:Asp-tRNA(Asn)/Glu-tRNA(Gln) amidotransferase subunit GatA [Mucilaginibacter polytrichastri]|uniref:Glutamyl-tRNA(Gln) amidotransferase subunit A n=1 Tax=Mucilaginibacter polytrichastri TaxID=1302689 RepID=A0A1Q6A691_9SPHI|nr:Asp-tRNA(Asn)/Glu-tRNA(Gln) amidotransferase subunit GatA [Mucilaginibacter polytrichastri]OKS89527.1 Glutamyl-tRNA(Gln) amidotransferase subunit A [Mucilaginibacter polytrichastri]SFS70844.1 aspartyl/glutamyl-tRNA(Asn/Gln) amidotransferase subunit A [Mucilaginibacter polytrichastri]